MLTFPHTQVKKFLNELLDPKSTLINFVLAYILVNLLSLLNLDSNSTIGLTVMFGIPISYFFQNYLNS